MKSLEDANEKSSLFLSTPRFKVDDRIFAFDDTSDLFYEAVIRQTRCDGGAIAVTDVSENNYNSDNNESLRWSYLVHYNGWNSRWDKWLSPDKLVPDTPENREKCLEALRKRKQEKQLSEQAEIRPKKQQRRNLSAAPGNQNKQLNAAFTYYQDYCSLPLTLKTVLVEESEKIGYNDENQENKCARFRLVHNLPAAVTARQVISHFMKKKIKQINKSSENNSAGTGNSSQQQANATPTADQVQSFCKGLVDLFQEALPVCLLYPQERPQYESFIKNYNNEARDKTWKLVDVYGCEYLLRLFVRLPALMQQSRSSADHRRFLLGPLLSELIILLQKNRQTCFKGNYRPPKHPEEWMDWERNLSNNSGSLARMDCTMSSPTAN